MSRALVVGGVASGVGKTSITLGLLEAARRRSLVVQALKIGPDFIDPEFHRTVTGRPSYTLDGWMCGRDRVTLTFDRATSDADVAIVEGVMGCFDGHGAGTDDGSTAQIAKWLGLPLVLVIDASAQSRSAAAVAKGFETFDPNLEIAGFIVNRVAGDRHARDVADAIRRTCRAPVLGTMRWNEELRLPERHLGLVTARESLTAEMIGRLGDAIEQSVDVSRLFAIARPRSSGGSAAAIDAPGGGRPEASREARFGRRKRGGAPLRASGAPLRVGVARDLAFQFYYPENFDLLRDAGAELVGWSPLDDADMPDVDGLYIGGGYPELHARRLAENVGVVKAVRAFIERGRPVYAECGGLMYLAERLEDDAGTVHAMVGALPATIRMRPRRLTLGYREVTLARETILGGAGVVARGHEFHMSTLDPVDGSVTRAYRLDDGRIEGFVIGRTLASYVHLHFASSPAVAAAFVDACARAR